MVSRLYYVGDKIEMKFRIESKLDDEFVIVARIYDGQGNQLTEILHPQIAERVVTLTLPQDLIKKSGDYVAIFYVQGREVRKEIPMHFAVVSRKVPHKAKRLPVVNLTESSTDSQIETAMGLATRMLRRINLDDAMAKETARIKTKQDLFPKDSRYSK